MFPSFRKHLLKTYDMPGTEYVLVNKRDKVSALMELKVETGMNK